MILVLLAIGVGLGASSCMNVRIPESGSRQRVLFYAAPTDLAPGSRIGARAVEGRLHRLGYHEVTQIDAPGQYATVRGGFEIFLRPFVYPDRNFQGGRIRLRFAGNLITRAEPTVQHFEPEDLRLDPERIAGFEGTTGAVLNPLKLQDAPPLLVKSLIAIEDRRFYHHPGIDPIGVVRAVWANFRHRETAQGGSTLTQQLARSLYLHNEKTMMRKVREAMIAIALESRYTKDQILEAYLNAVYWGTWGSMEIRGAREAARYYLGTDLEKADPAGIALLVAVIPAPNAFSPYNNPKRALARRNSVIKQLGQKRILTPQQVQTALAKPLPLKRPPSRPAEASYFIDAVRKEAEQRGAGNYLGQPGTAVFTTMDSDAQAACEDALRGGLKDLERNSRLHDSDQPLEGAVVSIDPASGEVRALVGGRDYLLYPFNRAYDARRQPGSLFKPFVYLAAFQNPLRDDGTYWTPATIVEDSPFEITSGGKDWTPENYDHEFRGNVTVRTALEQSLNVPTAKVANQVGIHRVAEAARDLGIRSSLNEVPSLAIGTSDVGLLEITGAYAALSAGGKAHTPTLLRAVLDPDGRPVSLDPLNDPPGAGRQECYLVTNVLQGVIQEGTAKAARGFSSKGDVAGKTGTTDDYVDAWFVGYTPERALGVWVGFDDRKPVGLTGAAAALPIWMDAMDAIEPSDGDGTFQVPSGIITVPIDPETGLIATANCPTFREEVFVEGTEPTQDCDQHNGGIITRLKNFFGF